LHFGHSLAGAFLLVQERELGLRHGRVGHVVVLVITLVVGRVMQLWLGPGILGNSPSAVAFDGQVVNSSDESEEARFTPVGSPGVSDDPVLSSVFHSEADHGDIVGDGGVIGVVDEDSSSVVLEGFGHCNSAGNGTSLVDLLSHVVLSFEGAEVGHVVDAVGVGHEAGLVGHAVLAHCDVRALDSIVMASCSVDGAGLISDFIVLHEVVGANGISSVAAIVEATAGNHYLGRDVNIWPGSISGDLDSVGERRSGSLGPAGAAVLGDVLVLDICEVVDAVDTVPHEGLGERHGVQRRQLL
jgi:hypothetical protein